MTTAKIYTTSPSTRTGSYSATDADKIRKQGECNYEPIEDVVGYIVPAVIASYTKDARVITADAEISGTSVPLTEPTPPSTSPE